MCKSSVISLLFLFVFIGYTNADTCTDLKILSFNTWGMPELFGSEFKKERIQAIAKEVSKGEFDIYLFQELWMKKDHQTIAAKLPKGYSITGFKQLNGLLWGNKSECDGKLFPEGCSGLAIVSKYPFKEVQFDKFSDHGNGEKVLVDGEVLVRKGAGRVRIEPLPNVAVDIFTTHTIADPDPSHGYNNSYYRMKQVYQLMDEWVLKSNADLIVLGGDFNAAPEDDKESVYQLVRSLMKNSAEEMYWKRNKWLEDEFATYANPLNTFTGGKDKPRMYDFIFWQDPYRNYGKITAKTSSFRLPLFKTQISKLRIVKEIKEQQKLRKIIWQNLLEGDINLRLPNIINNENKINKMRSLLAQKNSTEISLSDHEAITSTLSICLREKIEEIDYDTLD